MGGSVSVSDEFGMALDGNDVDTPRGQSAKQEVRRLRQLMLERSQQTMELMARARFAELDSDNNGYLENSELHAVVEWVMQAFGDKLGEDKESIKIKMMHRLDANKDGKLDAGEFEVLFKEMLNRTLLVERARAKFQEFDSNGNGTIESDEIRQVIDWTLQAYPAENLGTYQERLIANIDANKDGQLDLMEFVDLFEQMLVRVSLVQKAKAKFLELDEDKSGFIESEELSKLTDWVLESHVDKTAEQKANFKSSLLSRIDVNKDGRLDLVEFTDLFGEMLDRLELVEHAKATFRELDVDNSGFLEKSELTPVLEKWAFANRASLKTSNPEELVQQILEVLDIDKDGKINLMEFIEGFDNTMYEKKNPHVETVVEELGHHTHSIA